MTKYCEEHSCHSTDTPVITDQSAGSIQGSGHHHLQSLLEPWAHIPTEQPLLLHFTLICLNTESATLQMGIPCGVFHLVECCACGDQEDPWHFYYFTEGAELKYSRRHSYKGIRAVILWNCSGGPLYRGTEL